MWYKNVQTSYDMFYILTINRNTYKTHIKYGCNVWPFCKESIIIRAIWWSIKFNDKDTPVVFIYTRSVDLRVNQTSIVHTVFYFETLFFVPQPNRLLLKSCDMFIFNCSFSLNIYQNLFFIIFLIPCLILHHRSCTSTIFGRFSLSGFDKTPHQPYLIIWLRYPVCVQFWSFPMVIHPKINSSSNWIAHCVTPCQNKCTKISRQICFNYNSFMFLLNPR